MLGPVGLARVVAFSLDVDVRYCFVVVVGCVVDGDDCVVGVGVFGCGSDFLITFACFFSLG